MTTQERLDAILEAWDELVKISNDTSAKPEDILTAEDALDKQLETVAVLENHPPGTPRRTRP